VRQRASMAQAPGAPEVTLEAIGKVLRAKLGNPQRRV
jgi:hypothetical protein